MKNINLNPTQEKSTILVIKKKKFLVIKNVKQQSFIFFLLPQKTEINIKLNVLILTTGVKSINYMSKIINIFSNGIKSKILLLGLGYQAWSQNNILNFKLGYSHTVLLKLPSKELTLSIFRCRKKTINILIFGYNFFKICTFINKIKNLKKSNAYKEIGFYFKNKKRKIKNFKKK